ncbi:F-box domain-containing protein [Orpheovirus IHUMI-LCC2]|uniref:F-box domain-containing protein n=1 Tax=Orpheovirus IHUMI-LCC2 TaxID=2023057 RepID=A0A2I2L5F7_9VIRU|nr:F-box domain-containing protein [Orpheovirus IHUMI-LCC2]SNW62730.1 F-box domain-containing protein [Orpheovirus IHUMI-LCC2]
MDGTPTDIKRNIISYLSPEELINNKYINEEWNELCSNHNLWRQIIKDKFNVILPNNIDNPILLYKKLDSSADLYTWYIYKDYYIGNDISHKDIYECYINFQNDIFNKIDNIKIIEGYYVYNDKVLRIYLRISIQNIRRMKYYEVKRLLKGNKSIGSENFLEGINLINNIIKYREMIYIDENEEILYKFRDGSSFITSSTDNGRFTWSGSI